MPTPPLLTPRLQAAADFIAPCRLMADIGTDHAYLPVYLCMTGKCQAAVASDLRPGPLARAAATVERYGLQNRISLRLGSGAAPLTPGEADAIVTAGMGGLAIADILKAGAPVFRAAGQIVLQPMSHLPELRAALYRLGYTVRRETLAREGEKLYHVLALAPVPAPRPPTPLELYLGGGLLETRPAHFAAYCQAKRQQLKQKEAGLRQASRPDTARLAEVTRLLEEMEKRGLGDSQERG